MNQGRYHHEKLVPTLVTAFVLALGLAALLLLAGGLAPASALRSLANRASPDGAVASFDQWYPQIAARARVAGYGLLIATLVALRWRSNLVREVSVFLREFGAQATSARLAVGRLATENGLVVLYGLVGISVMGTVLRLWMMDLPISTDEAQTVVAYASRPFPITISAYQTPNNHILHSVLLHGLVAVFGLKLWILRLPALVAGILLVPLVFFLVRALGNRYMGLLAAAYVAVDPRLVQYSALARGYTIAILLMVLAALCFLYWKQAARFGSGFMGTFAILCALSLWTVPSSLYGVLTLFLWILVLLWRDQSASAAFALTAKTGLLMSLLVVFLYLPVVLLWGPQQFRARDIYLGVGHLESIQFALTEFPGLLARYWNPGVAPAWIAFWSVTLLAGFVVGLRRHPEGLLLASLAVLVPLVMIPVQGFGPALDSILRVFNYLTVILALPAAGALLLLVPGRRTGTGRRAAAVLALSACLMAVRLSSVGWGEMRENHVQRAGLSDPEPLLSLLYEVNAPGLRIRSPNRLVWPLRYYFLLDGQPQEAFRRAIPRDYRGRIVLVVHDELQSVGEAQMTIEDRFALEGRIDVQQLGTSGNASVHELVVRD